MCFKSLLETEPKHGWNTYSCVRIANNEKQTLQLRRNGQQIAKSCKVITVSKIGVARVIKQVGRL